MELGIELNRIAQAFADQSISDPLSTRKHVFLAPQCQSLGPKSINLFHISPEDE